MALLPIFATLRKSPTLKSMWICAKWRILPKSSKNRLNGNYAITSKGRGQLCPLGPLGHLGPFCPLGPLSD